MAFGGEVFKLWGTLGVDNSDVEKKLSDSAKKVQGFANQLSSVGKKMTLAFTVPLAAMAAKSIAAIEEHNRAVAQTAAVLKSTGGAANITAAGMDTLTKALGKQLAVDDDLVRAGANILLTFRNIKNEAGAGNDIFTQATRVMMDYAAATGTDATSAAFTLGKALNDPRRGVMLLTRAGATFTEAQKKQIDAMVKSGNVMGAQKLILQQLTDMYGGSAEAQISASQRIATAFDNLAESIGTQLLPYYEKFASVGEKAVSIFENLPGPVKEFAVGLGGVVAMTGPFLAALGTIASGFIAVAGAMGVAMLPLLGFIALAAAVAVAAGVVGYWVGTRLAKHFYGTADIATTELIPAIEQIGKSSDSTTTKAKKLAAALRAGAKGGVTPFTFALEQLEKGFKNGNITADEAIATLNQFPGALERFGVSADQFVASWIRDMQGVSGSLVNAQGAFIKFAGMTKQKLKDWADSVSGNFGTVEDAVNNVKGKITASKFLSSLLGTAKEQADFKKNTKTVTDRLYTLGASGGRVDRTIKQIQGLENAPAVMAALATATDDQLKKIADTMATIRNNQTDLPRQAADYADKLREAYKYALLLSKIRLPLTTQTSITRSFAAARNSVVGASGGIVTRPTLATIGEAGPEAVIPLDRTPGSYPLSTGGGNIAVSVYLDRKTFPRQTEYLARASGL